MSSTKRISEISDVRIVPAQEVFPGNPTLKGKFVARGICGQDERWGFTGGEIRTSPIVSIDIEAGTIETLNTIYKIVD